MLFIFGNRRDILLKYIAISIIALIMLKFSPGLEIKGALPDNPILFFVLIGLLTLIMLVLITSSNIFEEILDSFLVLITFSTFYLLFNIITQNYLISWIAGCLSIFAHYVFENNKIWKELWTIAIFSITIYILSSTLSLETLLLFVGILSVYDYVSVFLTKHMIHMAKPILDKYYKEATETKERTFMLGGGDVVIPISLSLSSFFSISPVVGVLSLFLTYLGVFVCLNIVEEFGYISAIPVICFYTLFGLSFGILFYCGHFLFTL